MKGYIGKLVFMITYLFMSTVYSAGEGGWVKSSQASFVAYNPVVTWNQKLITAISNCMVIGSLSDKGNIDSWLFVARPGLTVYNEMSITTTDKYMFLSGGYYETIMYQGGNIDALYQLTLSPDSIGYVVYSGSMDIPRGLHSSLMVNDYLYIFGGRNYNKGVNDTYQNTVSYAKFNRTTERLEAFQSGYPFKQIHGPVYSSFILRNKVYCYGMKAYDGSYYPYSYIESADIQEDGKLGPWTVVGGPYDHYVPAGAVFTQQSTLFVIENKKSLQDTINKCWVMDLKDTGVEGNKFKSVTGFAPPLDAGETLGLGTWDRFVYLPYTYNYIYDPLLTSTTLFEEPTEKK